MAVKWEDVSTRGKTTWWTTKIGRFKLSVGDIYLGIQGWFVHCNYLIDNVEIKAKDEKDAKEKALKMLKDILQDALKKLK